MGLGAGILCLAAGAIITFAINVNANGSGIDLHTIGIILMVIGALAIVLSLIFWSSWAGPGYYAGGRRSRTTVVDDTL